MKNNFRIFIRFLLVTAGAMLMALNINSFVHAAGLLPGGFTGITLLLQEIFLKYAHIQLPFTLFYWGLNIVPALLCFRYVGKRFTLLSLWAIVASGLFTDLLPGFDLTNEVMLCTIFGGIINGIAVSLCLLAGATSGGTDFISIFISEKTGRSIWNYIFIFNVLVLAVFGLLFGWNRALYSIIFQFVSTQILNTLYKRYQKSTLLIITEKPDEIVQIIREVTGHDATLFTGKGCYQGAERKMLYTVVSSDEEDKLLRSIKKTDPAAFVNILQTKMLKGNFIMKKQD
ncbi:MAG: YitT family protein [Treponema sp.]|nr:YitT family protein [Treponema sp.]